MFNADNSRAAEYAPGDTTVLRPYGGLFCGKTEMVFPKIQTEPESLGEDKNGHFPKKTEFPKFREQHFTYFHPPPLLT